MAKRLSERVFARIRSNAKRSISHNVVVFSALHDEIVEALNDGCSLKAIWETLYEEGRVSFKFDAFLRHAKKSTEMSRAISLIKGNKSSVAIKSISTTASKPAKNKQLSPKKTSLNQLKLKHSSLIQHRNERI